MTNEEVNNTLHVLMGLPTPFQVKLRNGKLGWAYHTGHGGYGRGWPRKMVADYCSESTPRCVLAEVEKKIWKSGGRRAVRYINELTKLLAPATAIIEGLEGGALLNTVGHWQFITTPAELRARAAVVVLKEKCPFKELGNCEGCYDAECKERE